MIGGTDLRDGGDPTECLPRGRGGCRSPRGCPAVFVDIGTGTCHSDPSRTEEALALGTRAALPVRCAGMASALERIDDIAGVHGLRVVGPRAGVGAGTGVIRDQERGGGRAARAARRIRAAHTSRAAFPVNVP